MLRSVTVYMRHTMPRRVALQYNMECGRDMVLNGRSATWIVMLTGMSVECYVANDLEPFFDGGKPAGVISIDSDMHKTHLAARPQFYCSFVEY